MFESTQERWIAEANCAGIVSISADAIISIDEDQRITLFNEGAERIFGYSRAEVLGAPIDILIPERLRANHREHVEGFAAGQVVARRMGERGATILGRRKNGQEFPADAAVSKLDVDGKRILTVAVRDITEQKRIEREQRFLADVGAAFAATLGYDETLRNVAHLVVRDLADVCIVDVIEDGQRLRRTVACRDTRMSSVADALEHVDLDLRRPYLGSAVLETRQPLLMADVTADYVDGIAQSVEHRRALQELGAKSLIAVPLLAHGRVGGVLLFVSTTQEHRFGQGDLALAMELARRAALAVDNARMYRLAERAIRARDEVLRIVAHDLRNPLGNILMQAALLRPRQGQTERRSRVPADKIERAARRMNRLIQDLLDVGRMEGGRLPIEQARVSADQITSSSVEAQKLLASSASLDLQLALPERLPQVWADHERLMQVFENLIGNAVKFTKPGGRITVGAAPRETEVLFWVADTGIGIDPGDLPHIFDEFWQAPKVGRRGAGLGLRIVRGIIEAHGGRLWVESEVGVGTTFFLTVPLPAPVPADGPVTATAHRGRAGDREGI